MSTMYFDLSEFRLGRRFRAGGRRTLPACGKRFQHAAGIRVGPRRCVVYVEATVTVITRQLLGKFGSTLQKHYWENFTPLSTLPGRSVGTVGEGIQSFMKHVGVADLPSKLQA
jgi:hypothetical protein